MCCYPHLHTTTSTTTATSGKDAWRRCMNLAKRCSNMRQLKAIHAIFITNGLHHNNYALSKLVSFVALDPSGSISYAHLLLSHSPSPPNSFLVNTLIRAHSLPPSPSPSTALLLLRHHPSPDPHSFHFALTASAASRPPSLLHGAPLHSSVLKLGLASSDPFVRAALLRLYASSPVTLPSAHKLFDEIPHSPPDPVLFNTLMNGYLRSPSPSRALSLFHRMLRSGGSPDRFCVATALAACARTGALRQGLWIHDYARREDPGFLSDVFVGTSLVDMYAKCGCVDGAAKVFDEMPTRNAFSWAAMAGAYATHGLAAEALRCLDRMASEDGLRPDGVVLLEALAACSHGGLEQEARELLHNMERRYGVRPRHEHYGCMVDLLCRKGKLGEALEVVRGMPMRPLASVWGAVLSGSTACGVLGVAELAAGELMRLERDGAAEEEDGVYVQLSNAYMGARRGEEAREVRRRMGERGIKKSPGCSVIEIDGEVSEFVSGDNVHPLRLHIDAMLDLLHHNIGDLTHTHSLELGSID